MVSALTGLARRGVLVKGGQFLDALARIRTFAFDKTGTLTRGQPAVRQVICQDGFTSDELLAVAAAVERRSAHPLAQAIVIEAEARGLNHAYAAAEAVQSLAGKGVQGVVDGCAVLVGSHALLHEQNGNCAALHEQIHAAEAAGQTVMVVSRGEDVLGFVGVADVPRPTSAAALRQLKALNPRFRTVMLTGDNPTVAAKIAADLGVIDDVRASLLPEDKAAAVRALQAEFGPLAMVGDGVNDAPALATATVGIAMGGAGTAQAMETADLVLMQDNLSHLPEAVRISRRAMGIIRQNIIFSLAIKVVFLALTLPGWATLWMAVFADMGASLIVTANGLRARR
jgi:Cd2+/Zn2+-exporting ATPase